MFRRFAWLSLGLTLAGALAAVGPAAQAQEKYLLREAAAAGDVSEKDDTTHMRMTVSVTGAQAPQSLEFSSRERKKYTETVLSVDGKGQPTEVRRVYSFARTTENEPGEPVKNVASSLHGKTVTLRRVGNKTVVRVAKGTISDEDRKDLEDDLDGSDETFFPDRALALGDEWMMDSEELRRQFAGAEKAVVRGKLLEIVTLGARRCARARVTLTVEGKMDDSPLRLTMALTGDVIHALDIQRSLAASLAGPLTTEGKEQGPDGKVMDVRGGGTMRADLKARWLKVGGKPVAAPK